jgi:hypothetical protein
MTVDVPYPEPHVLPTGTPILPEHAVYRGQTPHEIALQVIERHAGFPDPEFANAPTVVAAEWVCPGDAERYGLQPGNVAYHSPWDVAVLFEGSFTPNWPGGAYIGTPSTYRYLGMVVDLYSGSPYAKAASNDETDLERLFSDG